MLKTYLLILVRNLRKHKLHSAINLVGLAASTAVGIVLMLHAYNVLTWDAFHEQADDIYFLYRTRPTPEGHVPVYDTWAPLLAEVKADYPAVVEGVRFFGRREWVQSEGRRFQESIDYADAGLFDVFSIPLEKGDRAAALAGLNSAVISRTVAERLFGGEDPLGKAIMVDFSRQYTVTGVFGEMPANSSLNFDILLPLESVPGLQESGWDSSFLTTFVLLEKGTDPATLTEQFPAFVEKHIVPDERGELRLMPLRDVDNEFTGRRQYALPLLLIAVGILLIACINFTNLATVRAMLRAREIGMRKVLGASRGRLIRQFLGEAVFMSLLAFAGAMVLVELLLPMYGNLVDLELVLPYATDPRVLGALLALAMGVGLAAGAYPALFLSRFQPVAILKSGSVSGTKRAPLRSSLVVVQFALSVLLMIGIGVMYLQVRHMKSQDLRFDREHMLAIELSAADFEDREEGSSRIETFRNELAALSGVQAVSASQSVPGRYIGNFTLLRPEGQEDREPLDWRFTYVDAEYFSSYGMNFVEGRSFSAEMGGDAGFAAILNETAARTIGWDKAEGRRLMLGGRAATVVGVVEDFHFQSLQEPVEPVMHLYGGTSHPRYRFVSVRLAPGATEHTLAAIRDLWQRVDPSLELSYFFVDDLFGQLYSTQDNMMRIVGLAALLALFIAALGLFGLASFVTTQRTKEIGIRKVMGATAAQLVLLVSRDFARLVLVAVLVACPIAYLIMNRWLSDFPYRIEMGPAVFIAAGVAALAVALATVSYQAVKSALSDPVKALRSE